MLRIYIRSNPMPKIEDMPGEIASFPHTRGRPREAFLFITEQQGGIEIPLEDICVIKNALGFRERNPPIQAHHLRR